MADCKIIELGTSPKAVIESALQHLDDIKSIVLIVEYHNGYNQLALSDNMNNYELIGRLMSMVRYVQDKQREQAE